MTDFLTRPLIKPRPTESQRIEFIDIARALGIIAVAWSHTGHAPRAFINLFNMPMFFLISGMFFKADKSPRVFLKTRILELLLPLILFTAISALLEYFVFGMSGWQEFANEDFDFVRFHNVTLWFLVVLIYVTLFAYIVEHYFRPLPDRLAIYLISITFGMLLISADYHMPLFLSQTFIALPFFVIGYWLRNYIVSGMLFTPVIVTLAVIGTLYGMFYHISTNIHLLKFHPYFFQSFVPALSLTIIVLLISTFIANKFGSSKPVRWMLWIGEATLFVVLIHRIPIHLLDAWLGKLHETCLTSDAAMNTASLIIAIIVIVASIAAGKLVCAIFPWFFPARLRKTGLKKPSRK